MDAQLKERLASMKTSDKIIGAILLLAGLGVGGWALNILLPILIELAQNTIYFFAELVVLGILAMVFLDKNTWINLYYAWKNISRIIRRAIITSDPIGVLDTVVHRYETKLEEIDSNITVADGATKRQKKAIDDANKQRDQELNLAKAAERNGKTLQVGQHATAAQRWENSAKEMQPMFNTLTNAVTCMERARDLCESKLEDTRNQKVVLQRQLEALLSGQKAVRRIKRFLGRNPDLEMQELAVEEIERQASEAMSEIDQFMRIVNPVLETADLQRTADQMAAMEHFNTYISGGRSSRLLSSGDSTRSILSDANTEIGGKENQYINLLDAKTK